MERAKIENWLDTHIMLWKMQKEHHHLLDDDEAPGLDDFNVGLCGIPDGIHLFVWSREIYFKLISILQVTVTFDPNQYDGKLYASFMYKGVEVYTLLNALKGDN